MVSYSSISYLGSTWFITPRFKIDPDVLSDFRVLVKGCISHHFLIFSSHLLLLVVVYFLPRPQKKALNTDASKKEQVMPTLFAVYNLSKDQRSEDYDSYLAETKIPGIRGAPWCTEFNTWKIDQVLGPAVSEPEGDLPETPPYLYVAKIEVSDLDAMLNFLGTDAGQEFVKSWSVYVDPQAIFTIGHEV
jgi:hypothetical protein